jgi:hypothetical protein
MFSLLISMVTSVLMARAGYIGGQIRHTEIRETAVTNSVNEQAGEKDND